MWNMLCGLVFLTTEAGLVRMPASVCGACDCSVVLSTWMSRWVHIQITVKSETDLDLSPSPYVSVAWW